MRGCLYINLHNDVTFMHKKLLLQQKHVIIVMSRKKYVYVSVLMFVEFAERETLQITRLNGNN